SYSATVVVNWSVASDPVRKLVNNSSVPLSAGTSAAGDGTLLQLGFYSTATLSNPFSGTWVVLASTTMGDDGVNIDGKFSTSTILGSGTFTEPAVGTPLSIRFYDGTSVSTSSYFNSVSNISGAWNYIAPADVPPVISMVIDKDSGVVFDGAFGDFKTVRPIPEPSHAVLVLLAGIPILLRRRRN
ncbi:MAG: PEP-CTERM sorting domain-containing protein, partial [Sphingobacteriales bacterium]